MSAALDALRQRAVTDVIARGLKSRRPTWAPPLALSDELEGVLRDLDWLPPDEKPIGRLWATFGRPTSGMVRCAGFTLRVGCESDGMRIFEAQRWFDGSWRCGPMWRPSLDASSPWARRYPLAVRATELASAAVSVFAGDPDAQMRIGGILAGRCLQCMKKLTDPISIEIGIGPECRRFMSPDGVEMLRALARSP